jgi:hypothetical protein
MFFAGSILRRVTGRKGAMLAGSSFVCRVDWTKAKDSWRMGVASMARSLKPQCA